MITAPYNFVPLSDKVFFPDWAEDISQDIPFEDGEDGIITLTIVNKTPLFTKDGEENEWSSHIVDNKGNKHYFIPGTTLKGCFRAVLEILSFSKMNHFNDDSFGYRFFTTQIKDIDYPTDIKKANCCGWMYKKINDDYYISECSKGIQKITHSDLRKKFQHFYIGRDHETAECKQKSLCDANESFPYPEIIIKDNEIKTVPEGKYHVVCTGYMKGKKTEYLFSSDDSYSKDIKIKPEVFQTFNSVHSNTPYYAGLNGKNGYLKEQLKKGVRIPVFFEKNREGDIVSIGITRMYRYPFKNTIKDEVNNTSKDHSKNDLDLSDCIFGFINQQKQLKGRVHVGNAFCQDLIADNNCEIQEGVFGQPRASYYPLYLKQTKGHPIAHHSSEGAEIAGRKRYRIIKNFSTLPFSKGNGNENMIISIHPIPANKRFECKIRVHNLKKTEIGALLSAITFNQTNDTFHNLGLAKSYGYGIITCKIELSSHFKYSEEDYIKAFNEEISNFLQERGSKLAYEECLSKLVTIASASHTKEEMKQMSFKECEVYKEDRNFSTLQERSKTFNILINESDILEKKLKEQKAKEEAEEAIRIQKKTELDNILQEAETLEEAKNYEEAIRKYKLYIERGGDDVSYKIDNCIHKIKEQQRILNSPICDTLTTSSFGAFVGSLKKWKNNHNNDISSSDLESAYNVLKENISKMSDIKKKKKELKKVLGDELGTEWLHKLNL